MAGTAMLKTVGGSVGSDSEGADAEKRPLLKDQGFVPDFFDHWMEEYSSKVEADQLRAGQPEVKQTDKG